MAAKVVLMVGLLALTAWNVTRSLALEEARRFHGRRDLNSALRRSLDHLRRRPWSQDAAALAARCLSELDHADDAEPYYRRARGFGALSVEDQHCRAYGLIRANKREQAILAYQEILRLRPDDTLALRRLATVHYSQKQYNQVRGLAERLTHLPGGAEVGYAMLGTVHHEGLDPKAAVVAYEKVLGLDPALSTLPLPAPLFWTEFTEDLIKEGRAEDARRYLLDALSRRDDATLQWLRGKAEKALGASDDAEASCRRAVERDPALRGAWVVLGQLALQRRQPRQALDFLNRALALNPDDFETVYGLSVAYRQLGQLEEAARYSRKVQEIRNRSASPPTGMGSP